MSDGDNQVNLPLSRAVLSGANIGMPIEEVTVVDSEWTLIVDEPYLINGKKINAVNLQHQSGSRFLLNYVDPGDAVLTGMRVPPGGERAYMIQPNAGLKIWARSEPGNGDVKIAIERLAGG